MIYRVQYTPRVTVAIDRQVAYFFDQHVSLERVAVWLTDLYDLTDSLEHWPRRHPVDEDISAEVGIEIRKLIFGDYLIFYRVDDGHGCVDLVHFRHAAQETNRLTGDDL